MSAINVNLIYTNGEEINHHFQSGISAPLLLKLLYPPLSLFSRFPFPSKYLIYLLTHCGLVLVLEREREEKRKRLTSKIVGSYSEGNSPNEKTDNNEVLPHAPSPTITNLRRNYINHHIIITMGF